MSTMDDPGVGCSLLSPEAELYSLTWSALWQSVQALDPPDFELPSGCNRWRIRDLVCHLLIDAQDVLITLATPVRSEPTVDTAGYWNVTASPPDDDPLDELIPRLATAYGDSDLITHHLDDLGAAAHRAALHACPDARVSTQNKVLTVRNYLRAYVLEWTLHHLDLVGHDESVRVLPPAGVSETRQQLERVTRLRLPADIDDASAVLIVTGRRTPTPAEARMIGEDRLAHLPVSVN